MLHFHGAGKTSAFFEGWYFKHQQGERTIAFIPGLQIDGRGRKSAFVQIITEKGAWKVDYPATDFFASRDRLAVHVGRNVFTPAGARIDLHSAQIDCKGRIGYSRLTPPRYDAMGPFAWIPSLECNHGVVSLYHRLSGSVRLCGETIDLEGGTGYIEKDWGSSFPKSYLWAQSNDFAGKKCSVMVSVADVPLLGGSIRGCIGMVWVQGREYRLATYTGGRVAACWPGGVVLCQGDSRLDIRLLRGEPDRGAQRLLAPDGGRLARVIRESASRGARFRFQRRGRILLDEYSPHTSFEFVTL